MLFISNTCFAPFSTWSCKIASNKCCSSTRCVCCRRASNTASLRMLLAFSLSTSSIVVMGVPISFSRTRCSNSVFTDCMLMSSRLKTFVTVLPLMRNIPNNRCSGPTLRLARRLASSRENAKISDTFCENWLDTIIYNLVIYNLHSFILLQISCQLPVS